MKRCLAVLIVAGLGFFSMIGCGSGGDEPAMAPRPDDGDTSTMQAPNKVGADPEAATDDPPRLSPPNAPPSPPDAAPSPPEDDAPRTAARKTDFGPSPELRTQAAREGFVLQKVYYGTDRMPTESQDQRWQMFRSRCWRTAIAGLVTLLFAIVFLSSRRKIWAVLAIGGLVATLLFGGMTLREKDKVEQDVRNKNRVYRKGINEVDGKFQIERGVCFVSIPKVHEQGSGEFERPGWTDFKVDRNRHFDLPEVRLIDDRQEFLSYVRADVQASNRKQAMVFIHGYNVTFELAAMRTAQLAYDLRFEGPAAFFSWPSNGSATGYASDEESVELTVPQMSEFLTDLIKDTGAESVHVIAHSMGNRALAEMLIGLERVHNRDGLPVLNQVIMAAPDVNATKFRTNIVDQIKDAARNFTLYASSKDIALLSSEVLRRSDYPRLGQGGADRQVLPEIQTIDASDLPGDAIFKLELGHSYYVHPAVMRDLKYLVETPQPARQREWLQERPNQPAGSYWIFNLDAFLVP